MAVNIERLRQRLAELGLKAQPTSIKAGLGKDGIRNILRGASVNGRSDTLQKIAIALECSVAYLTDEADELGAPPTASASPRVASQFLATRYEVGAGYWVETDELKVFHEKYQVGSSPQYAGFDQWLEKVIGDSMDMFFPPGTLVHVVDAIQIGYAPKHDDFVVVVSREHGGMKIERSIKQIAFPRRGLVELWPRSNNPRWSSPLDISKGNQSADDLEVEIVGRVIGAYTPLI